MKRLLVTGGSGYLAGIIYKQLSKSNNIKCILGCRDAKKLEKNPAFQNAEIRHFDILNPKTFSAALTGIDYIVHLVSLDNKNSEQNPELAKKINTELAVRFFEEAVTKNVEHFIYFSTFHVYGPVVAGNIHESTAPKPVSVYAKTHLDTENLILYNKNKAQTITSVLRLSNAFGPPLDPESESWLLVANDLCKQAMLTKKIKINSSGLQKRDFLPAHCITDALETLLSQGIKVQNDAYPVYNLGSGKTLTILKLAETIQTLCEKYFQFTPPILVNNDPETIIYPDFTYKIEKLHYLGFNLSKSIEEEILNILFTLKKIMH